MLKIKSGAVLATWLLVGAVGCADLDVENPNEPDAKRALTTAGDVESLIAGSFAQWWQANARYEGPSFLLSAMSFQHSAWPANAGVYFYGGLPRPSIQNNQVHSEYGNAVEWAWTRNYKALSAVAAGLRAIDTDPSIASALGASAVARARAFGRFVQGLAHASVAILYDRGFIVDETVATIDASGQPGDLGEPVPYTQMMAAALGYLDQAIQLAEQNSFTIPSTWMGVQVDSDLLVKLAHSYKARFRAAVARTPAERAAVAWDQVLADINAGIDQDFEIPMNGDDYNTPWTNDIVNYLAFEGWQQLNYMILGMADTADAYLKWLATPVTDRNANLDLDGDGTLDPVLIRTPDKRFPQGETLDEQRCSPGTIYLIPDGDCDGNGRVDWFALEGNNWARPDRGTWRWSYYYNYDLIENYYGDAVPWPEMTVDEMNLLAAEAHYRLAGNTMTPEAAALVNRTRMAAGLDDISDGNDTCVPRLPNGQCGDFFEALKWEKRLQVQFRGLYGAPWYFDGRGWGELYYGTPLQLPIPAKELQGLGLPVNTFGGPGGDFSSPGSIYAWPHEK
jgi:hypothetical protein